jgi:hypothetical protein
LAVASRIAGFSSRPELVDAQFSAFNICRLAPMARIARIVVTVSGASE